MLRSIALIAVACFIGSTVAANAPAASSRGGCLAVQRSVVTAIASGLRYHGETLRAARAVRSGAFTRMYFVSADIQGAGMNGKSEIATWATNRINDYGVIYAVDGFAKRFSDWPDGGRSQAHITLYDDGALPSRDCARRALG